MEHDRFLDVARVDLEAAGDDHVLETIGQIDIAVGVQMADIAGRQASVGENLGRLVGAFPVSRHHLGAGDADFARFAWRQDPARRISRTRISTTVPG